MTIEEQYAPVTHKHIECPVCDSAELIQDIKQPRNAFDRLMISIRNNNAAFRIKQGKRIIVREEK